MDFEGDFPIEGAKEVNTILTRYVARPVRMWAAHQAQRVEQQRRQRRHKDSGGGGGQQLEQQQQQQQQGAGLGAGRLRVAEDRLGLVIVPALGGGSALADGDDIAGARRM